MIGTSTYSSVNWRHRAVVAAVQRRKLGVCSTRHRCALTAKSIAAMNKTAATLNQAFALGGSQESAATLRCKPDVWLSNSSFFANSAAAGTPLHVLPRICRQPVPRWLRPQRHLHFLRARSKPPCRSVFASDVEATPRPDERSGQS